MSKIDSYLGFAVKSGRIIYGIDNIEIYRKRIYTIVLCPNASQNLIDRVDRFCKQKQIPLVKTENPLEDIVYKTNCKVIALTDANMAKAVIENIGR